MSEHAAELRERGFTLLEGLIPADEAAGYGAALEQQWRRLGEPDLVSQEDVILGPGVHVSPVGMTVAGILERVPELAKVLLRPELLALFTDLLGPGFELEFSAGVVSDETRGFFFWHHHVGGIDAEDVRGRAYPRFERAERLGCTLYVTPLDAEQGVMLVWPRRVDDSTAPPFPPGREPWPGATEVRAGAGSVIVFDQGTWHAVTPMARSGQRFFFGFFVRRAGLPPMRRSDPGTVAALAANPALRGAYGGPA
ncbi:hypothetical protein ENSA5_33600 [Enhygromyxa salina]|uniref:Uncharacterized protein n=1 Tax=Enhygromyxa salina TaxID=215803 RepID=A0A2S9XX59_9BACT|nr:hypothetical protein [Enhygromyxa salina]PRP97467.1 hypothetical protein ENSA5_33600 [Enhygromyxa salina]